MSACSGSLTPLQADLLLATFGAGHEAAAAWRRWRDATDWEAHLDRDAFRLLPRTYASLREHEVADPLLPRLKGIGRQAWYANQHRLRAFQPVLRALAAAGIDLLILPPTALLLEDATAVLDPEAPWACAVRAAQAAPAIRCFWSEGWRSGVPVPRWSLDGYVLAADRLSLRHAAGPVSEVSWQPVAADRSGRFPDDIWARAVPSRLSNEPVLALDAADALHDVCLKPVGDDVFGRTVDLLLLLETTSTNPDWRRFIARAAEFPIGAGWRRIFEVVCELLPRLVPATVVDDWPTTAPRRPSSTATGGMRERIAVHWLTYRRALGGGYSLAGALRELPGYLLARWQLPSLGRIPPRFVRGLRYEWRNVRRGHEEDRPRR